MAGAEPAISVGRVYATQILGQLLLVAVVAVSLHAFYRVHPRRYLLHWARSWAALGAYALVAGVAPRLVGWSGHAAGVSLGLAFAALVAGYLHTVWLLAGTWEISLGRPFPLEGGRRFVALAALASVLSLLVALLGHRSGPLLAVAPRALVATLCYLATAAIVLRPVSGRPRLLGRWVMGLALLVYAVDESAYLALTLVGDLARFDRIATVSQFDVVAQALLALAMVIWMLEDSRQAALDAGEEMRRRERAQACVYRISEAAHSVEDLPELLRSIHASIADVLPARNFYIALFDPREQSLSFPYFVDEHDEPPDPKPLGRGLTEYVLRTRRPLLATPDRFRELVEQGEVELLFTDSVDWLGVPLLVGDAAIGVLVIQTYDPAVRLGPDERDLLVYVSEQVATAISARRAAEALGESEARLRLAVEHVPAVLWTTDSALRFTSSLGAGLAALGLRPNQVVGMALQEYLGEGDEGIAQHERALAGESVAYEYEVAGRQYGVRVEPLRDGDGVVRGTAGIALDLTEQRRAAGRLRQVIDLVPHLIFAKDAEGRFILANRAVAEAYGTTVEDLLGRADADFAPDPDEVRSFRRDDLEVLESGRRKDVPEEHLTDATGRVRFMQTTKIPFTFSDRPAILGVAIDFTERKAAEEALRRAAKEESLAVLAGGVAHDFNNLLAAVLGHVSLAIAKLPAASEARAHAERAAAAVEMGADLTRQMLAYSGRGRFVVEPTDLGDLVRTSLPLLKVTLSKSVTLDARLAAGIPLVEADAGQIQQVVMNLVINAGEAMGERGGSITVSTGTHELAAGDDRYERITGQPLSPGRYVLLEVRDDGPGMEPEVLSRIFDPFFTTKFTGRGLGLAAVLGVIRAHRGGLHVESGPEQGTAFRLLFAPAAREARRAEPGAVPAPGRELRLLLIDDEPEVREVLAELLGLQGIDVVTAGDGESGLDLFGERGAGFDAVVLDLSMPGLGGEATWARLLERRPGIPVILSSGHGREEVEARFGGRTPAGYLQKPYRAEELAAVVRSCVTAAAGGQGARPQ